MEFKEKERDRKRKRSCVVARLIRNNTEGYSSDTKEVIKTDILKNQANCSSHTKQGTTIAYSSLYYSRTSETGIHREKRRAVKRIIGSSCQIHSSDARERIGTDQVKIQAAC